VDTVVKIWESPYATFFNNPILYSDPTGESGVATINKETKVATVSMHLIFYGTKANNLLGAAITKSIQDDYNAAKGTILVKHIDGSKVKYDVEFNVTFEVVTEDKAFEMAQNNVSAVNNFIRVEDKDPISGHSVYAVGSNYGILGTNDGLVSNKTASHEIGHGLGLIHPKASFGGDEYNFLGQGQPDISIATNSSLGGAAVDEPFTVNPELGDSKIEYDNSNNPKIISNPMSGANRKVTNDNIKSIFKGRVLRGDKIQIGSVGNKIYKKDGTEMQN
jgi:hypothetical protein